MKQEVYLMKKRMTAFLMMMILAVSVAAAALSDAAYLRNNIGKSSNCFFNYYFRNSLINYLIRFTVSILIICNLRHALKKTRARFYGREITAFP